ncbi:MAG: site-specific integrase [Candidatus Aminicenantes bacterium]|nr:site-specific integrase [Candidatus Aminicenantes bacterium]
MNIIKVSEDDIIKALNVPELVSSFLACQDVREISKVAYQKGLERFLSWVAENGIEQPDRESILKFKFFMVESGLSANTVNSYLVAVKRFFAYLEGIRKYPDVAKGIKGIAQSRDHLKESLTAAQVKELLSQVDISSFQGRRDFAIINLMVRTGLRTIEVVRADVEDVKQEGGEALLFVQGKGRDSKDSFVILTEKALKPILAYLKERALVDPGDSLFASISDRNKGRRLTTRTIRQLIKDHLRKINIESRKLSAHSLRHSFATLALRAGAPLIQVKDALRHASIETTQKYLHNIERIEKGAERYIDF